MDVTTEDRAEIIAALEREAARLQTLIRDYGNQGKSTNVVVRAGRAGTKAMTALSPEVDRLMTEAVIRRVVAEEACTHARAAVLDLRDTMVRSGKRLTITQVDALVRETRAAREEVALDG